MSVYADIRNALESNVTNISGVPSSPSVAAANSFENVAFEPTQGTSWLRFRTSFLQRRRLPVPQDQGVLRYDGTFLVNVYTPSGQGPNAGETLADAVCAAYDAGTILSGASGLTVQIEWAEVSDQALSDPPWFIVPVTIKWKANSLD